MNYKEFAEKCKDNEMVIDISEQGLIVFTKEQGVKVIHK